MDYKKEIIEMIENTENEGKLKFAYTILIKYLKSKKQGDQPLLLLFSDETICFIAFLSSLSSALYSSIKSKMSGSDIRFPIMVA